MGYITRISTSLNDKCALSGYKTPTGADTRQMQQKCRLKQVGVNKQEDDDKRS